MSERFSRQDAALELDGVEFAFAGGPPMRFDLTVGGGEIVALMGASGSGKSTLLNLVAGFERPDAGRVLIGAADVTRLAPAARPVSMIFQENNLFAHLDVFANVALGRSPALRPTPDDREAVREALADTGLAGKEARMPAELSGGERQRVALARALVRRRAVLLLDEPFASLGPALRQDMLDRVAGLSARTGMTILMATHGPDDARRIAARIAFVEDGRVAELAPTEDFFGPAAPPAFTAYAGAAREVG